MMYGQEATQLRHSWLHYNSGGVRPLYGASSSTTHPSPVQSCADCWYNNTKIHLNQSSLVWKPRYVNIIKLKGNHRQWLQCSVFSAPPSILHSAGRCKVSLNFINRWRHQMSAVRPEIRAVNTAIKITIYQILIKAAKYEAGRIRAINTINVDTLLNTGKLHCPSGCR